MITRLVSLVLVAVAAGCQHAPNLDSERTSVRHLFEHMSTTLCAGDWASYQETWAHDSTVERLDAASGNWLTGWVALSPFYESMTPRIRGCNFEITKLHIHVSQDATMAWAVSEGTLSRADATIPPIVLWGAFGFEKRAGEWRMVLDHSAVKVSPGADSRN